MIEKLGKMIEPEKNKNGFRKCQVYVGGHIPCKPQDVPERLLQLIANFREMTPLEVYKEFETIHPFVDGNGRVGKIILNWFSNNLLTEPIFPPKNLWGHPIANP